MSAASGASTAANAASGELGARGRRSSFTDDRCTLVADDQHTTRMTHSGCRRNFRFASHQPCALHKADLSNRNITEHRNRRNDQI